LPSLVILIGVVVVAAHGLVEEFDDENFMAIILEDHEVPDFNGVPMGELSLVVVEEHLA
jgi:hypothetical protein